MDKPTAAQLRLLVALRTLAPDSGQIYTVTGLRGGALQHVIHACQRRGWIDAQGRITPSGAAIAGGAA